MAEIPVVSLDFHWQKQVESAQKAYDSGKYSQALATLSPVLLKFPACLPVRKLVRSLQLKLGAKPRTAFGRLLGAMATAPARWSAKSNLKKDPLRSVARADRLLMLDPNDVPALALLGRAAAALDWQATSVFAFEAACKLQPDNPPLMQGLGDALVLSGRTNEALVVARNLIQLQPKNADAQALFRNASIALTMTQGKRVRDPEPEVRPTVAVPKTKEQVMVAKWKKPGS